MAVATGRELGREYRRHEKTVTLVHDSCYHFVIIHSGEFISRWKRDEASAMDTSESCYLALGVRRISQAFKTS